MEAEMTSKPRKRMRLFVTENYSSSSDENTSDTSSNNDNLDRKHITETRRKLNSREKLPAYSDTDSDSDSGDSSRTSEDAENRLEVESGVSESEEGEKDEVSYGAVIRSNIYAGEQNVGRSLPLSSPENSESGEPSDLSSENEINDRYEDTVELPVQNSMDNIQPTERNSLDLGGLNSGIGDSNDSSLEDESGTSESSESDCSDDGFDISHNSEDDIASGCMPLFKDSSLSAREFNAVLLALKYRHNFSNAALDSVLKMLHICLPDGSKLPRSSYNFQQDIEKELQYSLTKYVTCMNCQTLLTEGFLCENEQCPRNGENGKGEDSSNFYVIRILPELRRLLSENWDAINQFTTSYNHAHGIHQDIIDGKLYQEQSAKVRRDGYFPVTLYWHLDGAPAFRSKNVSIWPIQSFVVELPIPLRYSYKNIIMSGLWYGRRKPNMEVFQLKFVEEVSLLAKGFTVSVNDCEIECKLSVNGQVADLIAKAPSINFILHNGKFGCCSCLHPGERFEGRGNKRVYPYISTAFQRRTHEDTQTHAQLAEDTGRTVFGVKGRSNVHSILKIPEMIPFDYMHQVLEGEFTRRMSNWLSGSCKSRVNLKPSVTSLSKLLQAIGLPHDFKRKFRSLEEFKRWKASEKQTFFLHASLPLLKKFLPAEIFYHHCLLVTGVRMLCEYGISDEQISIAEAMLLSYCRLLPQLYDLSEATFNSHAISHLADQVRAHGPLILHSAFVFESMLAHLKRLFHGTRGIPDQICKKLAVAQHMEYHVLDTLKGNRLAKEFADNLLGSHRLKDTITLANQVCFIGPFRPFTLGGEEIACLPSDTEKMAIAQRMTKDGEMYHSTSYVRKKNSVSFLVKINDVSEEYFGKVQYFVKHEDTGFAVINIFKNLQYNICSNGLPESNDPVVNEFITSGHLGYHFVAVEKTDEFKFINCSKIISNIILVQCESEREFGFVSTVLKCYQHD